MVGCPRFVLFDVSGGEVVTVGGTKVRLYASGETPTWRRNGGAGWRLTHTGAFGDAVHG